MAARSISKCNICKKKKKEKKSETRKSQVDCLFYFKSICFCWGCFCPSGCGELCPRLQAAGNEIGGIDAAVVSRWVSFQRCVLSERGDDLNNLNKKINVSFKIITLVIRKQTSKNARNIEYSLPLSFLILSFRLHLLLYTSVSPSFSLSASFSVNSHFIYSFFLSFFPISTLYTHILFV